MDLALLGKKTELFNIFNWLIIYSVCIIWWSNFSYLKESQWPQMDHFITGHNVIGSKQEYAFLFVAVKFYYKKKDNTTLGGSTGLSIRSTYISTIHQLLSYIKNQPICLFPYLWYIVSLTFKEYVILFRLACVQIILKIAADPMYSRQPRQ